jgi:hypothetical protein
MAVELFGHGYLHVPEAKADRFRAVAGVQWAMERAMTGVQFIVTAERATPLRTYGDDPQAPEQRVRRDGLLGRLDQGQPLHLVFCADGIGTAEQDHAYHRDIWSRYGAASGTPVLYEHLLPWPTADFPPLVSGAFILSGGDADSRAFAIRATQAQQTDSGRSIELFYGPIESPSAVSALTQQLGRWGRLLHDQFGLDCLELARAAQAGLGCVPSGS